MNAARIFLFVLLVTSFGCESETQAPKAETSPTTEPSKAQPSQTPPVEESRPEFSLPNQSEPIDGIVASGQPSREQFGSLRENGFRAVINFRTLRERGAWDETTDALTQKIGYAHIPIGGPEDLTKENVRKFDEALQQAPGDSKVLVHCGSSNRVGAMFALRAHWIQDKSAEEALALGKKAGLSSMEGAVKKLLEK
jgi:protein tyrosine phosphatase (PTP) superfamily phosphohydrolase (DUF442 family)